MKKKKSSASAVESTAPALTVCTSDRYVPLADLRSFDANPRTIDPGRTTEVDRSLCELGLFRPLLVWVDGNGSTVVIGGNQKLARLVALGRELVLPDGSPAPGVPVTVYEGDYTKARLVALRDNNTDGDWDYPKLSEYLSGLESDLSGFDGALDLTLAGFDASLLNDLVTYGNDPEVKVMQAAAASPVSVEPAPETSEQPKPGSTAAAETALSDPSQQVVGVVIGHIRGRIRQPTYKRLVDALSHGLADGIPDGGLDWAVSALLDRLVSK